FLRTGLSWQRMRIIGSRKILASVFLRFYFVRVFFSQKGIYKLNLVCGLTISAAIVHLLT
ncbi:hypothetical protein QP615_11120, partial [Providencia rettgeri]